ncbi:MAG: hypothetical protein LBG43_01420, partial [Treponema sp.]|nr:hypothetical protein [Treponema sp.]
MNMSTLWFKAMTLANDSRPLISAYFPRSRAAAVRWGPGPPRPGGGAEAAKARQQHAPPAPAA